MKEDAHQEMSPAPPSPSLILILILLIQIFLSEKKLVLQIPLKLFMLGVIYLAMEKDDLIKEIKQREEELDREKLLRQIQLKENELQRLLSGIDQKEFLVPGNGIWKIQSQKLDGKSIPKAEWIVPQMSPDFRYTISVCVWVGRGVESPSFRGFSFFSFFLQ